MKLFQYGTISREPFLRALMKNFTFEELPDWLVARDPELMEEMFHWLRRNNWIPPERPGEVVGRRLMGQSMREVNKGNHEEARKYEEAARKVAFLFAENKDSYCQICGTHSPYMGESGSKYCWVCANATGRWPVEFQQKCRICGTLAPVSRGKSAGNLCPDCTCKVRKQEGKKKEKYSPF
jgi:hypothetical protein